MSAAAPEHLHSSWLFVGVVHGMLGTASGQQPVVKDETYSMLGLLEACLLEGLDQPLSLVSTHLQQCFRPKARLQRLRLQAQQHKVKILGFH